MVGSGLLTCAIAKLTDSGWNSLENDLKATLADLIIGQLPRRLIVGQALILSPQYVQKVDAFIESAVTDVEPTASENNTFNEFTSKDFSQNSDELPNTEPVSRDIDIMSSLLPTPSDSKPVEPKNNASLSAEASEALLTIKKELDRERLDSDLLSNVLQQQNNPQIESTPLTLPDTQTAGPSLSLPLNMPATTAILQPDVSCSYPSQVQNQTESFMNIKSQLPTMLNQTNLLYPHAHDDSSTKLTLDNDDDFDYDESEDATFDPMTGMKAGMKRTLESTKKPNNAKFIKIGDVPPTDSTGILRNIFSGKFNCRFCFYSTMHKANVVDHERLHFRQHSFECQICFYTAKTKNTMSSHLKREHSLSFKKGNYEMIDKIVVSD